MRALFPLVGLLFISYGFASSTKCYGQSWTTDTYNTFKSDYYFDGYGRPLRYDRFIFSNTYGASPAIEERGYAYRYDLSCDKRENDIFKCNATCTQFLFRYTDANTVQYLKDCGSVFHNHFADASVHICLHDGKDVFADNKTILGKTEPFIIHMNGTVPALEQDFHSDSSCILHESVPIVLEGAIIAFILIAVCLITIFGGLLISSLKELGKKNNGYSSQLIPDVVSS